MIVVVAGVCGTGKSSVGHLIAKRLDVPFFDADDYHPKENVQKMSQGIPLSDDDRLPWLDELARLLNSLIESGGGVLACSALKQEYREHLSMHGGISIEWIFLIGDFELLKERLSARVGHFFNNDLLKSQLEIFEMPNYGLILDVNQSIDALVEHSINYVS